MSRAAGTAASMVPTGTRARGRVSSPGLGAICRPSRAMTVSMITVVVRVQDSLAKSRRRLG